MEVISTILYVRSAEHAPAVEVPQILTVVVASVLVRVMVFAGVVNQGRCQPTDGGGFCVEFCFQCGQKLHLAFPWCWHVVESVRRFNLQPLNGVTARDDEIFSHCQLCVRRHVVKPELEVVVLSPRRFVLLLQVFSVCGHRLRPLRRGIKLNPLWWSESCGGTLQNAARRWRWRWRRWLHRRTWLTHVRWKAHGSGAAAAKPAAAVGEEAVAADVRVVGGG